MMSEKVILLSNRELCDREYDLLEIWGAVGPKVVMLTNIEGDGQEIDPASLTQDERGMLEDALQEKYSIDISRRV